MTVTLSIRLMGSGERSDPWRVDLPTYQLLDVDYRNRTALVTVPDCDLPPDPIHAAMLSATSWERAKLAPRLRDVAIAAWHAHLDDRYQEHRGRFRPTPL